VTPEKIRELVNNNVVEGEKKTWLDIFKQLIGKTWNESKSQKLREIWAACSDYYGRPKFSEISKLRKLAALINLFCDSKAAVPSAVADVVKLIEQQGLANTAEILCEKPIYLGFVASPTQGDIFGGHFIFKVDVTKLFRRGSYFDKNGDKQIEFQRKQGWGFFNLYLNGNANQPHPHYKTEAEIDAAWEQTKKAFKVFEGNPKHIKIA
ncbi:MAG: hypothetical protein ACYSSI_02660, partial [Planctomycetota bacterium]|jgi:hypothetical protein